MSVIHAAFPNVSVASDALAALRSGGIAFTNTTVLGDEHSLSRDSATSPGVSDVLPVVAAGAVAVGMIATGVGILAAGPIGLAIAGLGASGVAGGFFAALGGAGLAETDARSAEDALVRGGVVVLLDVASADETRARSLLFDVGALPSPPAAYRDTLPDPSLRMEGETEGEMEGETDEPIGEGDRAAARRYQQGVETTIAEHDVDRLARHARRALEDPEEGPELERAEERSKAGPLWIDSEHAPK